MFLVDTKAKGVSVRGYRTLLLEQSDFAKGTSSRSTKLVHGGVRYLQQGNVALVLEALRERGLLIRNAPHLVRNLGFVVPHYDWWEGPFYGIGLKVYDVLAGKLGLGPSRHLDREETLERLRQDGLANDSEFASAWVENRTTFRPRSRRMMALELKQKGLDEEAIQSAMAEMVKGRTTIIIAHRLSTVRGCDSLFLLSSGRLQAAARDHADVLDAVRDLRDVRSRLAIRRHIVVPFDRAGARIVGGEKPG